MGSLSALEPAIPEHLRVERTIPASLPAQYEPPFPAYSARFPKEAQGLVNAIIGVQHSRTVDFPSTELQQLLSFVDNCPERSKPRYWEAASVSDNRGFYNEVVIPYWPDKECYDAWSAESGFRVWWQGLEPGAGKSGWFLELFLPSMDRFETVFSDNVVPEGAAHLRESVSGSLREHVYWGSMRDRLPLSQTDRMEGEKATIRSSSSVVAAATAAAIPGKQMDTRTRRIRVSGRKNLAVIRSGQDWSDTSPHERKLYLDAMHPILTTGMDFLRDRGAEVGCIACRFMDVHRRDESGIADAGVGREGNQRDQTFGLAYFDDLASLEDWSKNHETHLAIFARFLHYAAELQGNVSLRLFHEVMVLEPQQQVFEYIGCHETTGMLASIDLADMQN